MRLGFIIMFLLMFAYNLALCQTQVFFGLPSVKIELKKDDSIMLNMLRNFDGRILESEDLDKLKNYLSYNEHRQFLLEMYITQGSEEFRKNFAQHLARDLEQSLNKAGIKNTKIRGIGDKQFLFCDENEYTNKFGWLKIKVL